jgi:hypothetical protein
VAVPEQEPKTNPFEVTVPSAGTELQQAFMEGVAEMKRQGGDNYPTFGAFLQKVPV